MRLDAVAVFRLPKRARARGVSGSRRASARAAVASGLLAFAVANAALAYTLERSHCEWRDPEFGHRLILVKQRTAEAPGRPLILAVGSSRIQQGLHPAAMAMPDGPTDPMVINFGYRGATPAVAVRNVFRLLESGVRPSAVLIEFTPIWMVGGDGAFCPIRLWPNRLTAADVQWFVSTGLIDFEKPGRLRALVNWAGVSALPWTSHRQVLMPHWLPRWVPESQVEALGLERMDRDGFTDIQVTSTTSQFDLERIRASLAPIVRKTAIAESVRHTFQLLLDRCRSEGIAVGFVWVPLSPLVSGWIHPDAQLACERYAAELSHQPGVTVFPRPSWVVDDDFADGQHLLPPAASRYSRWLADGYLKPWLAAREVGR